MRSRTYYRNLFVLRACWNWVTTLTLALAWKKLLSALGMFVPKVPVWIFLSCGLIFISGIGNYWVSQDLDNNHGILKMDILGRILFFSLFLYYFLVGEAHYVFVLLGIGDMILAVLALEFLLHYKKPTTRY